MLENKEVRDLAITVLGSLDKAEEWLSNPMAGLDGLTPNYYLETDFGTDLDGVGLIYRMLVRLNLGGNS